MQEEVKRAWKMEKARAKAQQAADDFAKAVSDLAQKTLRDTNNPEAFRRGLSDLAATGKYTLLIDAIRIAKLNREPFAQMSAQGMPSFRYMPPSITDKRILYPLVSTSANPEGGMAEQLLELRNKPLGEALVLPNRPKNHF